MLLLPPAPPAFHSTARPAERLESADLPARALERAVLDAVAYADVFDAPLVAPEIRRYLPGVAARPGEVRLALEEGILTRRLLSRRGALYCLRGREALFTLRRRRARASKRLWAQGRAWGRVIAGLPLVRMVAVTGSLAARNAEPGADLDFLVVTRPGRLWMCHTLISGVVRLARLRGVRLCPNFVLDDSNLALRSRNLYAAHDLARMVPLWGLATYRRMRRRNAWTSEFLPNAAGPPAPAAGVRPTRALRAGFEPWLRRPLFDRLERAELQRKTRELVRLGHTGGESAFSPGVFKNHCGQRTRRVLEAFARRQRALQEQGA